MPSGSILVYHRLSNIVSHAPLPLVSSNAPCLVPRFQPNDIIATVSALLPNWSSQTGPICRFGNLYQISPSRPRFRYVFCLSLTNSDMQVFDNRDCGDQHPNLPSLNSPLHNANSSGDGSWEGLNELWGLHGSITEDQAISELDCSVESHSVAKTSSTSSSSTGCRDAANFYIPLEWWPSDLPLDIVYGKYESSTPPAVPIPCPPTTHNDTVDTSESLELSDEMARDSGSLLSTLSASNGECSTALKEHRIRNKLAAAKCRERVKRGVDALQRRERDLLRENKKLSSQACSLREEVYQLKCEVLRHSDCNNDCIHRYIQKTAENISNP